MARAAGRIGSPQAAREIADVCTELVRRRYGSHKGRERGPDHRPVRPAALPEAAGASGDGAPPAP
jgi:UDP-N-acetylglucosamine--N-acetylmuramyl-(pentapeptide) pyrophosphoryl-undecaprenol N-acetylglucosamine transferase